MLNVVDVEYNDSLDLALCIVAPQAEHSETFAPIPIPIDVSLPSVGDVVNMVTLSGMYAEKRDFVENASRAVMEIHRQTSVRTGVVTALHHLGYRHYRWPCFTTSILPRQE